MDSRKRSALPRRLEPTSPSIMQSLDSISIIEQDRGWDGLREPRPNPTIASNFNVNLEDKDNGSSSFLLIDGDERLQVPSVEQFSAKLGLSAEGTKVKVVSILGNSGDGKSHTMNHTFFNGNNVFPTSPSTSSCTIGALAAYDPLLKVICLDTEGLLGSTPKENQRIRLLLKILAVSDVVIYRTRAERLHRDLFTFLGSASKAFTQHFQTALQRLALTTPLSSLGPAVIIFHETKHTKPLQNCVEEGPEEYLMKRFGELQLATDAFSCIQYVGTQSSCTATDFSELKRAVHGQLLNNSVRSPRTPSVVYNTLKVLNDKFSDALDCSPAPLFPDQYFTCPEVCASCKARCQSSMGHLKDSLPHSSTERCVYQEQYQNYQYLCSKCHCNGVEQVVTSKAVSNGVAPWYGLAKYVWSGYVIDCPAHGELYSSRQQHWYGNVAPENCSTVRTEVVHVWSVEGQAQNTAQRVLDSVSYLSEAVVGVVAQPTKVIGSYVADQIAPKYWRPNSEITHCAGCGSVFPGTATKHHCRNCGEGFCEACSSHTAAVPRHGWLQPVRVCDACYNNLNENGPLASSKEASDVRARRYGELVLHTISSVSNVLHIPKDMIKDSARPSYWVPDADIPCCSICKQEWDSQRSLHHCRECGKGVCDPCSPHRRPVPSRGWENPVRVCSTCFTSS